MNQPFDVFISFKNLDERGQPTRDAALARSVFDHLVARNLRVFLSSITLERQGVSSYKKAIDQALDGAHVLVAVGTSAAHLNAEWVRYEWDSFFNDVLSGVKPTGQVFVYVDGVVSRELPRSLRQSRRRALCRSDPHGKPTRTQCFSGARRSPRSSWYARQRRSA